MSVSSIFNVFLNPNRNLKVSKNGIDTIKKFEALRLVAYQDEAGVWTIGYGHTKDVQQGMIIKPETALELLEEDLQGTEKAVRSLITAPLKQNQYDALVSWTFNVGIEALRISTLRRLLNNKEYLKVPEQMSRWNKIKVKGKYKTSNGLSRRRMYEGILFIK